MLSMRSYLFWYVLLSSFSLASVCHRFCTVGRWASWNLQYTYRTVQLLYKNIELNDFASANGMKRKHTVQYIQYIQYIRYVQYCILMLGNLLWNGYSTVLYIQYHLYCKWGMQQPVLLRLLQGPVPLPNLISIFLFLCQRSAFSLQLDQQLHRDLFQLLADSRKLCTKCGQLWCHPKMIVFVSWMKPLQYCNSSSNFGIWCCTVLGTQKSRSHPITVRYNKCQRHAAIH